MKTKLLGLGSILLTISITSCTPAQENLLDACVNVDSAYCSCLLDSSLNCSDGKADEDTAVTDSIAAVSKLPVRE